MSRFLKVREYCKLMNVSRDWVYAQIHSGRMPVVTFCGAPIRPWLIDVEKAMALFSSAQPNIISINSARSLETKKVSELASRKPVTKEDLWRD